MPKALYFAALALAGVSFPLAPTVMGQSSFSTVEELRIGSLDGPTALTYVEDAVPLRDGRTMVVQPQEFTLKLFDQAGNLAGSVGREGAGPGEFRRVSAAGLRADSMWVTDSSLRRVSFLTLDGELVRMITWPASGRFVPAAYLADGTLTANIVASRPEDVYTKDGRFPVLRFSSAGNSLDTLGFIDAKPKSIMVGGRSVMTPFNDAGIGEVSPNGDLVVVLDRRAATGAQPGRFTFTWIGLEGDTLHRAAFTYNPVRVSAEQMERLIGVYRASGAPQSYVEDAINGIKATSYLPPVRKMSVAADDAVWFTREQAAPERQMSRWYRATPDGRLTGYADLPSGSRMVHADGSHIWAVESGSFDEQYVVRYKYTR